MPTRRAVYMAQQYELEQRNETKSCRAFDRFELG